MKKSTKKILKISGSIFGVGAIVTSITLPIVLNASTPALNPNDVLYRFLDKEGNEQTLTVKQVMDTINKLGQEDKTKLNRFDYYTAFFLYEMEQKESLKLQEMWFKWDIYNLDKQIKELDNDSNLQNDKDKKNEKIKSLNEQKNKIQERLNNIQNALKTENPIDLDYGSSSFKSEYPKVLLPLERIRNEQKNVYNDEKNNEISKYTTRNQGEMAWELKRREKYNDAATDEEAIDYLTNKAVSDKAFGQFDFKINNEYTYEQKHFKDSDKNYVFTFLKEAIQAKGLTNTPDFNQENKDEKDYVGKTSRETKVYFIGSNSNDPNKIYLDLTKTDGINGAMLRKISAQKLIKVQHALISVKQSENGSSLPWDFVKDKNALKNLLSFFGNESQQKNVLKDLLPNVFQDDEATKTFIDHFSNDPSGKNKDGSLGVRTLLEYIKKMEAGFGLGILAILQNKLQTNDSRYGKNYLKELSKNLEQAKKDVWGEGENAPKNQEELKSKIDALKEKDIEIFGRAVKNTFDPESKGLQLFYPAGKGVNIVMSPNGIHIIKITNFSNLEDLKSEIKRDLELVATEKDVTKAKTDWGKLFSNYFSGNNRRKFIIDNFANNDNLKKYIEEKESKRKATQRITWDAIEKIVNAKENSQKVEDILNALGDKNKSFYIKGINDLLLKEDPTLKPEDIYKILIEQALQNKEGK